MKTPRPTRADLLARIDALEARVRALESALTRDPAPARNDVSAIVDRALRRAAARAHGTIRYKAAEAVPRAHAMVKAQVAADKALQRMEKRRKRQRSTDA